MNVSLRHTIGALVYDWIPFELHLRGLGANKGLREPWLLIRNRRETISTNGRGVQCHWRFSSDLHISNVFPSTAARLMRRALVRWPIAMRDAPPPMSGPPRVSFLIGHRGTARLPHLLSTLRNIAAQSGVAFECIVVEQSVAPEVEEHLPRWIRYIHTPLPRPDLPYCRSWAFNIAARHARGDVLVLHDNDVLIPERYAFEAVQRIDEGYSFADVKRFIYYLSAAATTRVFVTGAPPESAPARVVQNLDGGLSIVARRDAYDAIGGFDESYVGWGGEDNDFVDRAGVFGGVYRFGYLPMLHLEHPPQPGKLSLASGAIRRYRVMETVDPAERIARLRATEQGLMSGPAIADDVHRGG
ncbi:MAG: galactosyltransferase-related protein [Thermoanaerobaculia bacterium]